MSFSAFERRRLADLLLRKGPDAPTLCEGWTTRHMAAHLFVRENQPWAAAGMFVSALEGTLDSAMDAQLARDYDTVVKEWAAGPGRLNPLRLADRRVNTLEHFVHHEDVRRGGGEVSVREFSQAVNKEILADLKPLAKVLLKGSDKPVVLTPPDLPPIVVGAERGVAGLGDDVVRVYGQPGELALWAFGRDAVDVRVEGDVSAVHR